jgi:hypothetical protein
METLESVEEKAKAKARMQQLKTDYKAWKAEKKAKDKENEERKAADAEAEKAAKEEATAKEADEALRLKKEAEERNARGEPEPEAPKSREDQAHEHDKARK